MTRNVARMVKRPRQRREDVQRWTAVEASRFREHVLTDRLAGAWLLSLAGLRRSEVLGLRWSDVDLDAGTVRIEQGRVAVTPTTDTVDEPKSEQSRRTVPVGLVPGVTAALRGLRARQAADRLALGPAYLDSGLVVVDAAGKPPRPEWFSDRFRALCRAAGVPVIHLHETRHTLVSHLRSLQLSDDDIAAWLGHSVGVMTETYARTLPGSHERVGAAMGRMYLAVQ